MRFPFILAFLVGLLAAPLVAQAPATGINPPLEIAVDTAGISRVGPDIYVTWVFARAGAKAFPSSGIMVAFDCKQRLVKRLAHVVYQWNADSTGVEGPVVEDHSPWVEISIPTMFELVCGIGATRRHDAFEEPTTPEEDPWSGPARDWKVI